MEQADEKSGGHGWKHHAVEDQPVLEVEKDHLHQHGHKHAALSKDEQMRDLEVGGERAEESRAQHRRAVDLPGLEAGFQALEPAELYRAPARQPTRAGAEDSPSHREQQARQAASMPAFMASSGAGCPVQISNDCAPCARRTRQPSAQVRPRDRALRTSAVPPVT